MATGTDVDWLLYDNPLSGNCWKVRQILRWTCPPGSFRTETVSVVGDRDRDRAGTPVGAHHAGRIPLLVGSDGTTMAESNAILMHFAEGTDWMPTEPVLRHRVLEWLFFEQSTLLPGLAIPRYILHVLEPDAVPEEWRAHVAPFMQNRARPGLASMESRLRTSDSGWFVGAGPTIADVALYPYTRLASEAGLDLDDFSAVSEWLRAVESLDGFEPLPCV